MKLALAPMEGVIDYNMRRLLTNVGGYDRCVTEFVRVTDNVVPKKVLFRLCPELYHDGVTQAGVPVYVQFLGGDPENLAQSAKNAELLGAKGIDLNFGCPAKIVNRHDGGSVLLKEPHRIYQIVSAVRDNICADIPVCAKIRLGFDHSDYLEEIVNAVDRAGATELCIHARTKTDGYRPPAYWSQIGKLDTPHHSRILVNGEIWCPDDARLAQEQSGQKDIMIGRGGLACPDLALQIRANQGHDALYQPMDWVNVVQLVDQFFHLSDSKVPKYVGNRTKQWLAYLKRQYIEAEWLFETIKRCRDFAEISNLIRNHRDQLESLAFSSNWRSPSSMGTEVGSMKTQCDHQRRTSM